MLGLGLGPVALWLLYLVILTAAVVACKRPEIGLYVLIPLLPNQTVRYKLQDLPLGPQIIDLVLIGMLIGIFLQGKSVLSRNPLRAPILSLWILTFLTLWTGSVFNDLPFPLFPGDERFSQWKNYCRVPLLLFVVIGAVRTRKQMLIAVSLMTAGLLWVDRAFIATMQGRSFDTFSYALRDASTMSIAGVNGLGAFLAQMSVFLMAFAVSQPFFRKWAFTGVALVSSVCVAFTFSRGAYVGLLIGLFVIGAGKRRLLVFSLVAAMLLAGTAVLPKAVIARVTMTQSADGELDSSTAGRLDMWKRVTGMFLSNPLFGAGFDTIRFVAVNEDGLGDSHNYYLELLGEMGLAGLFVFLWIIFAGMRSSWRLYRKADDPLLNSIGLGSIAYLCCLVPLNFFGDRWSYVEITGYTFVILGLVMRGLEMMENEEQEEPAEDSNELVPEPAHA